MIAYTWADLKSYIDANATGKIGRVSVAPGWLHEGHRALIAEARANCDFLVGIIPDVYGFKSEFEGVQNPDPTIGYTGYAGEFEGLVDVLFWPQTVALTEWIGRLDNVRDRVDQVKVQLPYELPTDKHERDRLLFAIAGPLAWKYIFGINLGLFVTSWKDGIYRFMARDLLDIAGIDTLLVPPVRSGYIPYSSGLLRWVPPAYQDVLVNQVQLITGEETTREDIEATIAPYNWMRVESFERYTPYVQDLGSTYIWCELRVGNTETAVQDAQIY